jgi:hypothetical protein
MKFIEAIREELERKENPDLTYIITELSEDLSEVPTVTQGFDITPNMVIVVAIPQDHDSDKKYYIDANSLLRFAQSSDQPVAQAADQVLEKNEVKKEECSILIPDLDLEQTTHEIKFAPNESVRNEKLEGLFDYAGMIRELKEASYSVVKYSK